MDKFFLKRLRAIKSLHDSTDKPGEKEAARSMLERLMEAHNVTWEEIDRALSGTKLTYFKVGQDPKILVIFRQCVAKAKRWQGFGFYTHRNPNLVGVEVTKAEAKEIRVLFSYYREHWYEMVEVFFDAWLYQQTPILKPADPDSEPSQSDLQKWAKTRAIRKNIAELPDPTLKRIEA